MLGASRLNTLSAAASGPTPTYGAVSFSGSSYQTSGLTTTATDNKYMTVAFTFYLPSSATGSMMDLFAIRLGTASGEIGYHAVLQSTRLHNYFYNNTGGGTGQTYGDYAIATSNDWHQIVYYHDATSFANCKYYVDGVDRTSNLLNGPSFGEPAMANTNFNWGSSNVSVVIGNGISGWGDMGTDFDGKFSQIYVSNTASAPTISKFWDTTDNKPRDLGSYGNSTGLPRPLIYHYGSTTTFPTNRGTGFASYTLTATNSPADAEAPTYGTNGWYLFHIPSGEQLTSFIGSHQLGVMGYNTGNTIRAVAAVQDTSSTQNYLLPFLFNPTYKTFDIKSKVSTYTIANGYTGFTGRKAVSEVGKNIGTADATNYGLHYVPYNDGTYNYVRLYTMSSDGTVTLGNQTATTSPSVGTSAEHADIDYAGKNTAANYPQYVWYGRDDAGNNTRMGFFRVGSNLNRTAGNATFGTGNRATVIGTKTDYSNAPGQIYNSVSFSGSGTTARASTIVGSSGTVYDTADITHGLTGKVYAIEVSATSTTSKFFLYGQSATAPNNYAAVILNVTWSTSANPTFTLGSLSQEETIANRTASSYNFGTRLVASTNANEVILFYTVNGTDLYAKAAQVSTNSIGWASAVFLGSIPNGAYSLDVQQAYIDANNSYVIGMTNGADGENVQGAMTLFAVSYKGVTNSFVTPTTYAVAANAGATSVNEGSSLTFNVTGSNITNGTYYWGIDVSGGDFATVSGSFTITSNSGSFSVTPTADNTTEGAETFTVSVRTGSTSGTVVATSSSITINDTSTTPVTTSMSYIINASSTASTITIPASATTGDVAVLWDYSSTTTLTVPSGWTQISTATTTGIRLTISYKRLGGGDSGSTITGMAGTTRKAMAILRGNVIPTTITPTTFGSQATTISPTNQTMTAGGSAPYIYFSGFAFTLTAPATTWSPAGSPSSVSSVSSSGVVGRFQIYNSGGASSTTVSMGDGGTNAMISFRMNFV